MDSLFLKLFNNSISACWLVLAILLARLLLKKAPKSALCTLWALVGLRLVLPIKLKSIFSLIPSASTVDESILHTAAPLISSGFPMLDKAVNPVISPAVTPEAVAPASQSAAFTLPSLVHIASLLWLAGIAAMLIYAIVSYFRLHAKVAESVPLRGNIRLCPNIDSPFVLGMIAPRIYLPTGMEERSMELVKSHERAHIARHDNLTKPLAFLVLSIYWFNPLLWLSYALLCRDMELACDEWVINTMGVEVKKEYSHALLNCSVPRYAASACPVAFAGVGVKYRIESVLSYKKPAFWLTIAATLALGVLSICFLTDPAGPRFNVKKNPVVIAESVDLRYSSPYARDMSEAQLDEFMSARLALLKDTRESNIYAGLTPLYYIHAIFQDGSSLKINGYSELEDIVDLQYKGSRYVVEDKDFAAYVSRFCTGTDEAKAQFIAAHTGPDSVSTAPDAVSAKTNIFEDIFLPAAEGILGNSLEDINSALDSYGYDHFLGDEATFFAYDPKAAAGYIWGTSSALGYVHAALFSSSLMGEDIPGAVVNFPKDKSPVYFICSNAYDAGTEVKSVAEIKEFIEKESLRISAEAAEKAASSEPKPEASSLTMFENVFLPAADGSAGHSWGELCYALTQRGYSYYEEAGVFVSNDPENPQSSIVASVEDIDGTKQLSFLKYSLTIGDEFRGVKAVFLENGTPITPRYFADIYNSRYGDEVQSVDALADYIRTGEIN